jgi:hypothetical protein
MVASVLTADLADISNDVNKVGTVVDTEVIRSHWNQRASVRVTDHPADSVDDPAIFVSKCLGDAWVLGGSKLGNAVINGVKGDPIDGVDVVIPGVVS